MIDNFEIIKPLLVFDSDDDFYYLQILQRKKEHPELGANSRVIKNYYINSLEYLERRYNEIKDICNQFGARASLRLNRRSYRKVAYKAMINMANTMSNREFEFCRKSYDRACGQSHNDRRKLWILDFDNVTSDDIDIDRIDSILAETAPVGGKLETVIPSKTGLHIITTPFDQRDGLLNYYRKQENNELVKFEVHKDNPTNLYIP